MDVLNKDTDTLIEKSINEYLKSDDFTLDKISEILVDKPITLETILKKCLVDYEYCVNNNEIRANWARFLDLLDFASKKKYIRFIRIFSILEDAFEGVPIKEFENLFIEIENRMQWFLYLTSQMAEEEHAACVKCFQILLKRIDKHTDPTLYGRILTFLASIISLSNPSGTNRRGDINLSNLISIMDEKDFQSIENVDFDKEFYKKLWSAMKTIQNPNEIQKNKQEEEVISQMRSILKEIERKIMKNKSYPSKNIELTNITPEKYFFPKFLSDPNLLVMEMEDISFLRLILTYFYLFIQTSKNIFVDSNNEEVMADSDQKKLRSETSLNAKSLKMDICKTLQNLPGGKKFLTILNDIVKKETIWVEWKNNKCPPFEVPESDIFTNKRPRESDQDNLNDFLKDLQFLDKLNYSIKRKKSSEGFKNSSNTLRERRDNFIDMGNENMNNIWNIEPVEYHGVVNLNKLVEINDMPFGFDEVDMMDWMMRRSILKYHDLQLYNKIVLAPSDEDKLKFKKKFGLKAYKKLILKGINTLEKYEEMTKNEEKISSNETKSTVTQNDNTDIVSNNDRDEKNEEQNDDEYSV